MDEASSVARNMHQAAENLREAVLALGTQTPSDMLSMSPSRLLQFAQEQLEPLFSQASSGSRQKNNASANKRKSLLVDAVQTYRSAVEPHEVRVLGSSASAIIACGMIPPKISFVIKGLMNSIKVCHTSCSKNRSMPYGSLPGREHRKPPEINLSKSGGFYSFLHKSRLAGSCQPVGQSNKKSLHFPLSRHRRDANFRSKQDGRRPHRRCLGRKPNQSARHPIKRQCDQ